MVCDCGLNQLKRHSCKYIIRRSMLGHVDRADIALFRPTINELLPDDPVARFYVRAAERLDVSTLGAQYSTTERRKGYPLTKSLALWLYGYLSGVTRSLRLR